MENSADWRTESRAVYSNDFKLHIVELASQPGANVAKIARENGVAHNLIFKWLRMWQHEGAGVTSPTCDHFPTFNSITVTCRNRTGGHCI
ncbi:transposase [Raoultella ornithinolytica]|jgi:transposase-like protein|uniref:Transposase n=1 Tax=Raoultella ornithinolytica TaxID=54291 RepID=A0ABD7QRL3_RAOOR|nr:transposase [Raoultella ornithinolytica]